MSNDKGAPPPDKYNKKEENKEKFPLLWPFLCIKKQFAGNTWEKLRHASQKDTRDTKELATKDANDLFNRFDHEHMSSLVRSV